MDITPFFITNLPAANTAAAIEVRPCCREDNVVDYAIWIHNKLAYTITYSDSGNKWIVALKNADEDVDDYMVQRIGAEIERRNKNSYV